jgi:hypothetical protein
MAKRAMMVVGLDLPWPTAEYVPINSDRSLLDGDVIVIHPSILNEFPSSDTFQGKPSYNENNSFKIRESIHHWKSQIASALSAGKTVIVFLVAQEIFHIDTGQKNYSGTGRNARTHRVVEPKSNYEMIPCPLGNAANATGARISKEKRMWPIEGYWNAMEPESQYAVTFDAADKLTSLLRTPDGSQIVSAFTQPKGCLVLVPDFVYPEDLVEEGEDGEEVWAETAKKFARRLESAFIAVENEVRAQVSRTEPPEWAKNDEHRLPAEHEFETKIAEISEKIASLQGDHQAKIAALENYVSIKALLYEKGHELAAAVRGAFKEIGFEVSALDDGESEFDAILVADGMRYLGEVEGKDDRATNVDKISQLERNLNEDFERDEINERATGVLIANAFRLKEPLARGEFFTEKVLKAAERTGIRLVRTTDLFRIIQEHRRNPDSSFAKACRFALHEQAGKIVEFPLPPLSPSENIEVSEREQQQVARRMG